MATINKKQAGAIANETAQEMGYENATNLMSSLKEGVALKSVAASKTASSFLTQVTLKVLKQELITPDMEDKYESFVSKFDDGLLDAGNSKEYIFELSTGLSTYDVNAFVPEYINPLVEAQMLSMFEIVDSVTQLTPYAFQMKKGVSIALNSWSYYFVNNKLSEYISSVVKNLKKSIYLKIYDLIMTQILTATPQKTITGTATNNFNAFTQEIFPNIEMLSQYTNVYNLKATSKYATASTKEDLIMIMSTNNKVKYNSGILSQTFNAKYADFEAFIDPKNIIVPGKKFTIGDQNSAITYTDTPYIDDNTIIVLDRRNIKFLKQLDLTESQRYSENIVEQSTVHYWGLTAVLPQTKIFKYTNANLSSAPAGE